MTDTASFIFCCLVALSLSNLALGQAASENANGPPACDDSIVRSLTKQCRNVNKLKDLKEFLDFYQNFDHLTNKCLRPNSALKEPSSASQLAEDECKQQNLLFYQVRQLAKLATTWLAPGGQVCNMEFSMRIYHFHHQVNMNESQNKLLARMLRLLANGVAWKCRLTLAKRLKNVQTRAPDAQQHVRFVINLINLVNGDKFVSKLKPLGEVVQFIPVLERELPEQVSGAATSIGQDGFELKSANSVRLSYETVRMSCKALKTYHVNILGSMGLLANLGYGSPKNVALEQVAATNLKLTESKSEQETIQQWLLSALLCQSLRNVLRMQTNTVEGKLRYRFKVMSSQEADVSRDDEHDSTFATFRLPEQVPSELMDEMAKAQLIDLLAGHKHDTPTSQRAAARKAHLLSGPNYKLARSIGTYLDVTKSAGRLEAIEEAIGMKLEFDENAEDEAEDEEEEEE